VNAEPRDDAASDRRVAVLGDYQVVNRDKTPLAALSEEDRSVLMSGLAADIRRLSQHNP
jgi:hypothetical protein